MRPPIPAVVRWGCASVLLSPTLLAMSACTPEPPPQIVREAVSASPDTPYSEVVRVGDTYFFSGKTGATDSTRALPDDQRIIPETRAIFAAFEGALQRQGLTFADVVNANVYLTDIGDFADMNSVYIEHFPTDRPARTTVAVAALPNSGIVEISFIAIALPATAARRDSLAAQRDSLR
jgi:2-iminobutanoate/2-iminopropanoate deaminase